MPDTEIHVAIAKLTEKFSNFDEKLDGIVAATEKKVDDHEARLRNLEVFRNWSAGVGAAGTAVWALVQSSGSYLSKIIGTGT